MPTSVKRDVARRIGLPTHVPGLQVRAPASLRLSLLLDYPSLMVFVGTRCSFDTVMRCRREVLKPTGEILILRANCATLGWVKRRKVPFPRVLNAEQQGLTFLSLATFTELPGQYLNSGV